MSGGEISGNTAGSYGGGVCVAEDKTFTKTDGTITGYESDPVYGNVVKISGTAQSRRGHAVYVFRSRYMDIIRDTTAGPADNF